MPSLSPLKKAKKLTQKCYRLKTFAQSNKSQKLNFVSLFVNSLFHIIILQWIQNQHQILHFLAKKMFFFYYKLVLELSLHPSTAWENQAVKITIPPNSCAT